MMPEIAAGTTTRSRDLEPVRAERVGAVAQVAGDGGHRVLGDRRDRRDDHHAHHEPGRKRALDVVLEPGVLEQGPDEREGEVAVHHRRDPGEHLEGRLQECSDGGRAYSLR